MHTSLRRQLRMCRLSVKWEGALPGSVDSVLQAEVFQECGSTDPMRICRGAGRIFLCDRLDEPTKPSLGMVASLQSPLHMAKSLYLAS